VPRKPERFAEVAGVIERAGFRCWRRSQHADGESAADWPADTVVLGDTMGELRKFYVLSQLAFVGRSLAPMGGSDVMEAAALGRAVLVGPHTENFAEPVERLGSAGGLAVVRDETQFAAEADRLLGDAAARSAMGKAARAAVLAAQGATARTVAVIRRWFRAVKSEQ
jgi:3-deoxy-D-manno-octulosonic-acid transferase